MKERIDPLRNLLKWTISNAKIMNLFGWNTRNFLEIEEHFDKMREDLDDFREYC